jgi:hypothetical protein
LLPKDELGGMAVAVKAESATIEPSMAYGPEHGFAAQLVKAIPRIDKEYCCLKGRCVPWVRRLGWVVILVVGRLHPWQRGRGWGWRGHL